MSVRLKSMMANYSHLKQVMLSQARPAMNLGILLQKPKGLTESLLITCKS